MNEKQGVLPAGRRWIQGLIGRISLAGICAVLALFVFARFSAEFRDQDGRLPQFDHQVLDYFQNHRIGWLYHFAYGVSWTFRPPGMVVMAIVAALAFFLQRRRDVAATLLLGGIGGAGMMTGLKLLFHRPRPQEIFAPLGYSFPSGHTFMAVTILGIVGYYLAEEVSRRYRPWIWGVSVFVMILVGWSRMYLGEHFPSDVGAGASAAICWLWVCLYVRSYFWHNTPTTQRTPSAQLNEGPGEAPVGMQAEPPQTAS